MADPDNTEGEENTTPPPIEEEQATETVNDDVEEPREEPEPENTEPDVTARLDALEKELAALKAMLDTLGYDDTTASDGEGAEPETSGESIEDLFD